MKKLLVFALTPLLLTSCGDSFSESSTTTVQSAVVSESDYVSAIGVLLASLILRDGDIEQAIADGRVTVQEVDAAIISLENETLSDWAALASE